MPDPPVSTGFDPLFGDPLRKLIERAKAEGYNPSILSGVRDDETQRQLVANAAATRAGQPLPYPEHGPVKKAAPVGFSAHEYGVAGDVSGIPQGELQRLGSQVGLNTIPGDPGHVELANWRQVASSQPPPTPWSETNPANVPSRMAMNVDAASAPGTSLNSISLDRTKTTPQERAAFYRDYIKTAYPNKDPNLALGIAAKEGLFAPGAGPSRIDVRDGHPFSWGDFQMNTDPGALGAKATAAGFDPRDPNQWQQTGKYAIDQMYAGEGYNVAPWKGDPVAAAYLKTGEIPTSVAMTQPTQPSAPSGQGGIRSDAVAGGGASTPAPPTTGDMVGAAWGAVNKEGKGGESPLDKVQKAVDADSKQADQQAKDAAARDQQALQAQMEHAAQMGATRQQAITAQAGPLLQQTLAAAAKPVSWSSAPIGAGQMPGAGAGGQLPQSQAPAGMIPDPQAMMRRGAAAPMMSTDDLMAFMQQAPGITLNSMGDLYG